MTKYFKAFPTTYKVGLLSQCMIVYHQAMLVISIPPYHPNMIRKIKNIIFVVIHSLNWRMGGGDGLVEEVFTFLGELIVGDVGLGEVDGHHELRVRVGVGGELEHVRRTG